MVISAAAAEKIREWGKQLSQALAIRLKTTSDSRTADFERFFGEFAEYSGNTRIIREEGGEDELPAILVSPSLTYHALPHDRELAPFLDILANSLGAGEPPDAALQKRLAQVSWPADVKVFIAAACPHCPETVRRIAPLALHRPWIQISIVDGVLFPELADPLGIRAVPTILLDGAFRWTGSMDMNEFLETMIHRDGALLPASALKTLLKEGQADRLAEMMIERGTIFPAFTDLVTHPEWSVRLGAVVVVEEIVDQNPGLAASILPPLWERFSAVDTTVKGDILYLTGLAGSPEVWGNSLQAVLGSDLPEDVKDGAREALDNWGSGDDA